MVENPSFFTACLFICFLTSPGPSRCIFPSLLTWNYLSCAVFFLLQPPCWLEFSAFLVLSMVRVTGSLTFLLHFHCPFQHKFFLLVLLCDYSFHSTFAWAQLDLSVHQSWLDIRLLRGFPLALQGAVNCCYHPPTSSALLSGRSREKYN